MNVGLDDEALQRDRQNTEEGEDWPQAAETRGRGGPAPGKTPFRSPFRAIRFHNHNLLFDGFGLVGQVRAPSTRIHPAHSAVTLPSGYEIVRWREAVALKNPMPFVPF